MAQHIVRMGSESLGEWAMNFAMLDVAIGLVLLYLLLSLVCSALVEGINHLCNRRGAMLEMHLERLMGRKSVAEFRRLPAFAALAPQGVTPARDSAVALPPARGVLAVLRVTWSRLVARLRARRWLPETSRFPAYIPSDKFAEIALAWHDKYNASREWCDDHEFGRMLIGLSRQVGTDRAAFVQGIAKWFDQAMARTSGQFKAQTNAWYAVVALTLVLIANADSIRLANDIYRNPAIQAALVGQAATVKASGLDAQKDPTALRSALQQYPLLGWPEERPNLAVFDNPWLAVGYLVTVLALMMGADFWFNALQKLIRIRTSLKPDETRSAAPAVVVVGTDGANTVSAPEAGSGDRTAAPAIAFAKPKGTLPDELNWYAPTFARVSAFAYDRSGALPADLGAAGYTAGARFNHAATGTQGLILEHADHRVLAFRGTEPSEFVDIQTDLKKALVAFPKDLLDAGDVRVHQGFVEALAGVWPAVIDALRAGDPSRPLVITGHSLGGGLAVLAAYALSRQEAPFNVRGVYTYGQPRAGDGAFAESYDRLLRLRHWRVVNNRDVVPRLAPRSMGYAHTGRVLYLDANGRPSIDPTTWFQLLDLVPVDAGMDWNSQVREFVADHGVAAYIRMLAEIDQATA
jgi:triacylglycerol lipase